MPHNAPQGTSELASSGTCHPRASVALKGAPTRTSLWSSWDDKPTPGALLPSVKAQTLSKTKPWSPESHRAAGNWGGRGRINLRLLLSRFRLQATQRGYLQPATDTGSFQWLPLGPYQCGAQRLQSSPSQPFDSTGTAGSAKSRGREREAPASRAAG